MFDHNCSPFLTRLFFFLFLASGFTESLDKRVEILSFIYLLFEIEATETTMEWLKIMIRLGSVYFLFSSNSCASFFHSVIELRDQREDARRPPGGGGVKSSVETMFFLAFHNDNYETVIIYQIMFSQRMSETHLWRNSFRTTFLFYFLYIYCTGTLKGLLMSSWTTFWIFIQLPSWSIFKHKFFTWLWAAF